MLEDRGKDHQHQSEIIELEAKTSKSSTSSKALVLMMKVVAAFSNKVFLFNVSLTLVIAYPNLSILPIMNLIFNPFPSLTGILKGTTSIPININLRSYPRSSRVRVDCIFVQITTAFFEF